MTHVGPRACTLLCKGRTACEVSRRPPRSPRKRHHGPLAVLGYDGAHDTYVDLVEAGIIDPTKVVRIALENAVSVASLLLLTEATLTKIPEPKGEGAPGSAPAYE